LLCGILLLFIHAAVGVVIFEKKLIGMPRPKKAKIDHLELTRERLLP